MSERKLYPFVSDPQVLLAATAIPAAFADHGAEMDLRNCNKITFLLTVDINQATNVEIKLLGKAASAATAEYEVYKHLRDWGEPDTSTDIIDNKLIQIADDADGYVMVEFDIPVGMFWQLQLNCTDGGTDGTIASSYIKSYQ